jgi:hypothetical protein
VPNTGSLIDSLPRSNSSSPRLLPCGGDARKGLAPLKPGAAGYLSWSKHRPGRPEEFHLQSPTDPYVNLSAYTARAGRALTASPLSGDTERRRSSRLPGWRSRSIGRLLPFAPRPLQAIHRYYRRIRPPHVHRYFPPSWITLIGFSLSITCRVPTFHKRARTKLVPTLRRVPPGQ